MDYDNPQFIAAIRKHLEKWTYDHPHNAPAHEGDASPEQVAPISDAAPTPKRYQETYYSHPDPTPLWKIVLETAAVFVGLYVAIVYHGQLKVMSGQLTEMEHARTQAKTDNAAAIAAQQTIAQDSLTKSQENFDRSAKSSEQTFQEQQRAWLGISANGITKYPTPPKDGETSNITPFSATVNFFNSGRTPAIHVTHAISVGIYDSLLPEPPAKDKKYTFVKGGATPPGAGGGITADESNGRTVPAGVSLTMMVFSVDRQLQARTKYLFIHGVVGYDDVYGKKHVTTFCFYMFDPVAHTLGFCEKGNDMN